MGTKYIFIYWVLDKVSIRIEEHEKGRYNRSDIVRPGKHNERYDHEQRPTCISINGRRGITWNLLLPCED